MTARHNLGEAFLHALDDIRQKVVEEGWTGATQTPTRQVDHLHSDPMAALYGTVAAGGLVVSARGPDVPPGKNDPNDRGIDAAYSAFVARCAASGIDAKDRDVSDLFWSTYAAADDGLSWGKTAYPCESGRAPQVEPPGSHRGEDQGIEL